MMMNNNRLKKQVYDKGEFPAAAVGASNSNNQGGATVNSTLPISS